MMASAALSVVSQQLLALGAAAAASTTQMGVWVPWVGLPGRLPSPCVLAVLGGSTLTMHVSIWVTCRAWALRQAYSRHRARRRRGANWVLRVVGVG